MAEYLGDAGGFPTFRPISNPQRNHPIPIASLFALSYFFAAA